MAKAWTMATWIVAALAASMLLGAGLPKLIAQEMQVENFERWGYAPWFMYAVGAFEVAMAVLILVPRTAAYAGLAVVVEMAGAVVTHIRAEEWVEISFSLVVAALYGFVAWRRRADRWTPSS